MKNNIIYLNKLHIQINENQEISYCKVKCNANNSIPLYKLKSKENICPKCLKIINDLKCKDCSFREKWTCDIMGAGLKENSKACFMFWNEDK